MNLMAGAGVPGYRPLPILPTMPETATTRLLLIRHAAIAMAGRFCGHTDAPLSEQGMAQLPGLVKELAATKFAQIYSSDLQRCRQTAQALAEWHRANPICQSTLREIHFGRWEAWSWQQIEADDPQYARQWIEQYPLLASPGGEDFLSFQARIRMALEQIAEAHRGEQVAVVAHGGVLRVAAMMAAAAPLEEFGKLHFGYTESLRLEIGPAGWRIGSI